MKFSALAKGTRAVRRVVVPNLKNADESPVEVGLRPLTAGEYADVISLSKVYVKARGSADATIGDSLYDLAVMGHTLAIAALDADSPEADPKPFFDTGVEPLLANLDVDTIAYLYEQHELWQMECSPYAHRLTHAEMIEQVREVTGPEGERAFMRMSPAMRMTFVRFLAVQVWSSLAPNSSGGASSESSTAS